MDWSFELGSPRGLKSNDHLISPIDNWNKDQNKIEVTRQLYQKQAKVVDARNLIKGLILYSEKNIDNIISFAILVSTVREKKISLSTWILQMREAGHMYACVKDEIYPSPGLFM